MANVISAFPGTGKTFVLDHYRGGGAVLDADVGNYCWLHVSDGMLERNPDFPGNFTAHIKESVGRAALVLVSSHAVARRALTEAAIDYALVYPKPDLREEYLERFRRRGSPPEFLALMNTYWDDYIAGIVDDPASCKIELQAGQYLSDVIDQIK